MAQPGGRRLRLVGGVQHVAGDTPPTSIQNAAGAGRVPGSTTSADLHRLREARESHPALARRVPESRSGAERRPLLLTPYAATALASRTATIAVRHSRTGLSRRLRVGDRVVLVDRRGGLHDGVVEDLAFTENDVVYLLGPERRASSATPTRARILDFDLARRRRAEREDGALR